MNEKDREHYRQLLHRLGDEISGAAGSLAGEAFQSTADDTRGNASKAPMHMGDLSSLQYEQQVSAELLSVERETLGEIAAALDRLDSGTFAICENCQRHIGRARLEALPYARLCIRCADKA